MKLHMYLALVLAGLCAVAQGAPKKKQTGNLGNVLYIGDSITHGFRAPSYRWALHKILVDNGIQYEEIGVITGNHSSGGGVEPNTLYIGQPFKNVHAAMSGQRAYETSGRDHEKHQKANRMESTDIFDWLEIEGKADSDKLRLGQVPDTCLILLGTNDTVSDYNPIAKDISTVQRNLLDKKKGDLCVIVDAIRSVNPKARVHVLSVPAWGDMPKNNSPKDYEAVVKKLNAAIAKRFKKEFVDLNVGLVDIACVEKPGKAVAEMMNPQDKLHPTRHGDMIMAGLVARALGIAGRSAGMPRKAGSAFALNAQSLFGAATEKTGAALEGQAVTLEPAAKLAAPWAAEDDAKSGFSAELSLSLGDGARNGWKKEPLVSFSVGNGVHSGTLQISECYYMWNGKVLYPCDMSKNREAVRVAWIPGSEAQNVMKGFYVWLGDMLIGEGLPDTPGAKLSGVALENLSDLPVKVNGLAADPSSLAPASKAVVKEAVSVVYDEEAPAAAAPQEKK